jgi:hypothetical protein
MKIQYQGNQQDLEYVPLWALQHSPKGKTLVRAILFVKFWIPFSIGALFWPSNPTVAATIWVSVSTIWLVRSKGAPRKATISSLIKPADLELQMIDPTLPGARPITLCLTEEGLSRDTTIIHSLWRWRMFDAAQERPEGIVLYTAADSAYVFIPHRAFASAEECEQFFRLCNEKIKQANADLREASRVLPPPLPTKPVR